MLHEVVGLDESRLELRNDLKFALGYDTGSAARRFILLPCHQPRAATFEEHIEALNSEIAFSSSQIDFKVAIASKKDIRLALGFHPYCDTGHVAGSDYVMRFYNILLWHKWATLKSEPSSSLEEPNVFFEPPGRLLEGSTPDQRKAGKWAFYLYSDSLGNIVFEVVPLAVQYPLGATKPKSIIFDPKYLTSLPATLAFRR